MNQRLLIMIGCLVAIAAVATAIIFATDLTLILFLAVLFGVFLTHGSKLISTRTPLAYHGSLAILTSILVMLVVGGVLLLGVKVEKQISKASEHIDEAQQRLSQFAERHPAVSSVISATPLLREIIPLEQDQSPNGTTTSDESSNAEKPAANSNESSEGNSADSLTSMPGVQAIAKKGATAVAGLFKTTLGLLVNSLLVFFVGLFIAVAPDKYRDGVVALFPPKRRERTRAVMNEMGDTLWQWLIGRFASMLVTGVGAGLILLLLGVPMAISLGVVTALLTFIPNIGSVIALMLAILFALPQGGSTVAIIVVAYLVLQLLESYVVTPLIQQQQVSLPPALLIGFQALMGVLFGFLGAAVASPLLAAGKVGVEEVYVHDILEADADTSTAAP